jgi:2-polyprenyl-6-methoxyphenol hydroxylase-like FAD-dependent oxidoreductase
VGQTGRGKVIVVGAGPTGLMLAAELALAGVDCLVLERRDRLRTHSRAICLHARSMEMLDLRGQAADFAAAGLPVPSFPLGLKGAVIGFGRLDGDFPYLLDIPQHEIERLLAGRASELGAAIRWSSPVTGIEQDDRQVRVTAADGTVHQAAYLVGCDGTRSFVREAVGLPFPGAPNPGSVILADLFLDGLPMTDSYGDLSEGGMLLVFPFRDGSCRLVLYDFARAGVPAAEPVSLAEVRDGLARITGQDFGARDMYWSARYRSESRQVPAYRRGRIFLAGDAAHTHSPAGAQGMNTGLQDAVNLGWKLGAALAGWAPGWLLDTYHSERHPVGAAVLTLTGRQFRLNTARSRPRRALRWAAHRVIVPLPPVQTWLARGYSGIAIRYPPADQRGQPAAPAGPHRLAGRRLPPGQLTYPDGSRHRVYDLFCDGRFVLLHRAGVAAGQSGPVTEAVLPGPVRSVGYTACERAQLPAAALVRPDGYLAWASDDPDPAALARATRAAVARWCTPSLR